jgi:hypothetical protein
MGVMRSVDVKELVVFGFKGRRVQGLKISSAKTKTGSQPQPSQSICFPLSLLDTTAFVVVSEISEDCTNRLTEKAAFAQCLGASARSKDEARCCGRCSRSEWLHLGVLEDSVVVLLLVEDVKLCSEKKMKVAFLAYHVSE